MFLITISIIFALDDDVGILLTQVPKADGIYVDGMANLIGVHRIDKANVGDLVSTPWRQEPQTALPVAGPVAKIR